MPFTLAHPAIVLPFLWIKPKYVSFTALVIGSVTPDFEYFIRMKILSLHSHTLAGIFHFDLPIAIMLFCTFDNIVRAPLINNLPLPLEERFIMYRKRRATSMESRSWYIVIVSILIGITSHLLWDSFTHRTGFFVESFSWLTNTFEWNGAEIPKYKVAQHGSPMVGFLFLVLVITRMKKSPTKPEKSFGRYWLTTAIVALAITGVRFLLSASDFTLGNLIVTAISSLLSGLIVSSILDSANPNQKVT